MPVKNTPWIFLVALLAFMFVSACEATYPEVAITNTIDDRILIRNISFRGCKWDDMLAYEDTTGPRRCLPGSDHIHFQKFDPKAFCEEQIENGTFDDFCFCDENQGKDVSEMDSGLINKKPIWFNYQTKRVFKVGYGEFHHFELTQDDLEQDFSVPGPYGH